MVISQFLAQASGVANGNRRLDDDPGDRVHGAHGGNGGLDRRGVEEVPLAVVVRGRRDHSVVSAGIGLRRVEGSTQIELPLPRLLLGEEALDLVVLDGRHERVDLLDLLGHDVQGVNLVVL